MGVRCLATIISGLTLRDTALAAEEASHALAEVRLRRAEDEMEMPLDDRVGDAVPARRTGRQPDLVEEVQAVGVVAGDPGVARRLGDDVVERTCALVALESGRDDPCCQC